MRRETGRKSTYQETIKQFFKAVAHRKKPQRKTSADEWEETAIWRMRAETVKEHWRKRKLTEIKTDWQCQGCGFRAGLCEVMKKLGDSQSHNILLHNFYSTFSDISGWLVAELVGKRVNKLWSFPFADRKT